MKSMKLDPGSNLWLGQQTHSQSRIKFCEMSKTIIFDLVNAKLNV